MQRSPRTIHAFPATLAADRVRAQQWAAIRTAAHEPTLTEICRAEAEQTSAGIRRAFEQQRWPELRENDHAAAERARQVAAARLEARDRFLGLCDDTALPESSRRALTAAAALLVHPETHATEVARLSALALAIGGNNAAYRTRIAQHTYAAIWGALNGEPGQVTSELRAIDRKLEEARAADIRERMASEDALNQEERDADEYAATTGRAEDERDWCSDTADRY